jgi:hypothetical protein
MRARHIAQHIATPHDVEFLAPVRCSCPLRRNSAQKSCGHARDPFCIGIAPHTQTHPAPEIFARAQCATKQGTLARRLTGASGRPVELVASAIYDESFFAV